MAEAPWFEIKGINKANRNDPYDRIDNICGVGRQGQPWKITVVQAINDIEQGNYRFYVSVDGDAVAVEVAVSRYGNKYLKTVADGDLPNNLLSLPECK